LADDAHWCREYAKINAVALRKILEQHDRMMHNNEGQHLLQVHSTDLSTLSAFMYCMHILSPFVHAKMKACEALSHTMA